MPKRALPADDVPDGSEGEGEEEDSDEPLEEDEEGSETSDSGSSDGDDEFPDVSDRDEDGGDGEEGDEDDAEAKTEIVINFGFSSPKEIDFLGLKTLLASYLDGQEYDSSGLVNSILNQDNVGSVVKPDEDDDPVAVFTVLNTTSHKDQAWLQQTREFLISKCSNTAVRQKLQEAIDQEGTGLLLNERLINCPPKIAPPLMQFLFNEIKEAAQTLPKKEAAAFCFSRFLVATRVYADHERSAGGTSRRDEAGPSSGGGSMQSKKRKVTPGPSNSSEPVLVYLRPEDEFLHKYCTWHYTFPIEGRPMGKDDLQPLRMVMLVGADKIAAVRKDLDAVVGNMAARH